MAQEIIINAINVGGPRGPKGEDGAGVEPATKDTLGTVKIGEGLDIAEDGTLSNPSAETATSAQTTADSALTTAQDALQSANEAKDVAETADTAAGYAQATADEAKEALKDYTRTSNLARVALTGNYDDLESTPIYLSDFDNDEDFQTEEQVEAAINSKLTSVLDYKGAVPTYDDLPTEGVKIGDVYDVQDTGNNYAWDGSTWDKLGDTVDLSGYYTKTETDELLDKKITAPITGTAGQVLTKTEDGTEWADAEGGVTLYDTTGQNTDGAMTQKAVTDTIFYGNRTDRIAIAPISIGTSGSNFVNIGGGTFGESSVAIGHDSNTQRGGVAIGREATNANPYGVAVGFEAGAGAMYSLALGAFAKTTRQGELNIGLPGKTLGFNNSAYRLISGVYDGIDPHDACTIGQLNAAVGNIETLLAAINTGAGV